MEKLLFMPPVVFLVIFVAMWLLSLLFSRIAYRPKQHTSNEGESYACGEENYNHLAQPDYSQFFPFAFFFTLAHVATLIMTTVPVGALGVFAMAGVYIASATIGLYILFRR